MTTARPAALVGAYAALPSPRADQEHFYEGLAYRGSPTALRSRSSATGSRTTYRGSPHGHAAVSPAR